MEINYEIWGAKSTWVDGSASEQKASIKYAATDRDTFRENYEAGRIPLNDIDKSVVYWGIGKDSIWCKPHYLSPYQKDGETEVAIDPIFKEDLEQLPIIFMAEAGSANQYIRYSNRYAPMRTDSPPQQSPYGIKTVLDFAYLNVIAVPWVVLKKQGYQSTTSSSSLYDYIENQGYLTNPEIIGIAYQCFFGDGEGISRTSGNIGFCSPVDYQIYNVYYGSNYFWAQDGCEQLLPTSELGTSGHPVIGNTFTGTTTTINNLIGDSVTALAYKYSVAAGTSVKPYYFDPDNPLWKINKTTERSGNTVWYEYPYIEVTTENINDVKDYILKQIAFLGLPFVYDPNKATQGKIGDVGVYLPVFDENLITTGEYEEGANALILPNADWTDAHQKEYNPDVKPTPEPTDNPLLPVGLEFTLANNGTGIWALTPSNIDEVLDDIFGSNMKAEVFGNNPMNAILSLKWTPFEWTPSGTQSITPVVLGNQVVNPLHRYPLIDTINSAEKHGWGTMKFQFDKNFYNARNMQARLFLPFYGYYELPIAQLLSSELRIDFYYDVPDELGVYIISYDKVIYDFVECSIDIDVPLTGSNAAAIAQSKKAEALQIATQIASTALTTMAFVGTGGLSGVSQFISMSKDAGSLVGGLQSLPYLYDAAPREAISQVAGLTTAATLAGGTGTGVLNAISNGRVQRAALKTNLPYHGSALQTTFLHMSMKPYVQIFKNTIMGNLDKEQGSTVKVKLSGEDEAQYKLKVGHACDVWSTIENMPEQSLLQATGLADTNTNGMELAEVQELNQILQTGFYR